jgi:capsular exopolysaccharide synthesis family protein
MHEPRLSRKRTPREGKRWSHSRLVALEVGVLAIIVAPVIVAAGFFWEGQKIWAATAVGILVCYWLARLGRSMPARVRSPEEIYRRIGAHSIAAIENISRSDFRLLPPNQRTVFGYIIEKPSSRVAEAFRKIHFVAGRSKRGSGKVLAVASAAPKEGASTVSLGLARTMSAHGERVIVIDCDLRQRTLTNSLSLTPELGIWEAVSGQASLADALYMDDEHDTAVLPATRGGVFRELFAGRQFFDLIEKLKREYNCIILDCPPVLSSVDTRMIARAADGVLLVVHWGRTSAAAVQTAGAIIGKLGLPLPMGIVLNRVPRPARDRMSNARQAAGRTHYA